MSRVSNLNIKHLSRDSFIRLLDHLIETAMAGQINVSRNEPPPEGQKVLFVSSPSFDFALSGVKRIIFSDGGCKDILMHPGDVHYCPKGHWKHPLWDHDHEMSSIIFYPDFIRVTFIDFNQETTPSYQNRGADVYYHTNIPLDESGMLIVQSIDTIIRAKQSLEVVSPLVKGLLMITRDILKNDHNIPTGKRNATWIRIKHYLQDNFHHPINRNSVAKEFKMSPSYISQLFAEKESDGFIGLLRKLRIRHGALLLTTTDLSVDEITEQCGYISTSYFISEFKKEYGLSPGKYRLCRQ
jgi:AraC-like DNA-binding protein